MSNLAIEIDDVWFSFGETIVLEAVNLHVEEGQFLGLIGPNGGGKSVLLKVMLGLLKPDRGRVRIFGEPPHKARVPIGYVPQFARFDMSFPIQVLDVVRMGQLGVGKRPDVARSIRHDRAMAALEKAEVADLADRQIGQLSGGQLQRVLIARALATNPKLLLLDEPTASLDPTVGRDFYQLLEDLSLNMTVVLVSHDVGVIWKHVQVIACINRKLYYECSKDLTKEQIEHMYGCPVELVFHHHPEGAAPSREVALAQPASPGLPGRLPSGSIDRLSEKGVVPERADGESLDLTAQEGGAGKDTAGRPLGAAPGDIGRFEVAAGDPLDSSGNQSREGEAPAGAPGEPARSDSSTKRKGS